MNSRWWWSTAIIVAAVSILFADLKHFTWWAAIQYYGYAVLEICDIGHRFVVAYVVQAILIIVGVTIMSIMSCDVLKDAADEYGLLYLGLNFLIHYFPLVTVIALPPKQPVPNKRFQAALGVAFFVYYTTNLEAEHVYGCNLPHWSTPVAAGGALLLVFYIWKLGWILNWLPRPSTNGSSPKQKPAPEPKSQFSM